VVTISTELGHKNDAGETTEQNDVVVILRTTAQRCVKETSIQLHIIQKYSKVIQVSGDGTIGCDQTMDAHASLVLTL